MQWAGKGPEGFWGSRVCVHSVSVEVSVMWSVHLTKFSEQTLSFCISLSVNFTSEQKLQTSVKLRILLL
jgi:hypothetical protein